MTPDMIVFAHAAHWLPQVLMLAPLPLLAVGVLVGRLRERSRGRAAAPPPTPGADA
jgi:hypothetical protein